MTTRRAQTALVLAGAVLLGVVAVSASSGWDRTELWLPDLLTGWSLILIGVLAWTRRAANGTAVLIGATGVAWLLGMAPALLFLHRGPLVHLLVTYPGWRPRTRLATAAVVAGYAAAVTPGIWATDEATIGLSFSTLLLVILCAVGAPGSEPGQRWAAISAATVLLAASAGGAVWRLVEGSVASVLPTLLAYEVALIAAMLLLYSQLPRRPPGHLTDLVIELGEGPSLALRDRLAAALGDPQLQLGYWSGAEARYVSDDGRQVAEHAPAEGRLVTLVTKAGAPHAAIVHNEQAMPGKVLEEAVARAVRLGDTNSSLRQALDEQFRQIHASWQRIMAAAEEELRRLHDRLTKGPDRQLNELCAALQRLTPGTVEEPLERARAHASDIRIDLTRLSQGLVPIDLVDGGLERAVAQLAARTPCEAAVQFEAAALPASVESAAYFVCAEALTNVAKHAGASRVVLAIAIDGDTLIVSVRDDGQGGADPTAGTGLERLSDRVSAIGGSLEVISGPTQGTTVRAAIPLADRRP